MGSKQFTGWVVGAAALAASAGFVAAMVDGAMASGEAEGRAGGTSEARGEGTHDLVEALRKAGYTDVREVEPGSSGHAVEATDPAGRKVELLVDATSALPRAGGYDEHESGHDREHEDHDD